MSNLKILVVGGGGREHALCWKIARSPLVEKIFCAPGNGGTALEEKTENINIPVDDFEGIAACAKDNSVDFIVIGPDNPLADGIVDHLEDKGLKVFGPKKASAQLESSKSFAKEIMKKIGIPTSKFAVFKNKEEAVKFARQNSWAQVVKADGLAFGKGVFVCSNIDEVEEALKECFDDNAFGESGQTVILEEKLVGEELSIFLLSDGKSILKLADSQDHKRRYEGDKGPNTGGMGAYSPVPLYEKYKEKIDQQIVEPLEKALKEGNLEYKGVLFIGIMVANDIPYVLEFNARFGDPEAQAILPRLKSDIVPALKACIEGTLDKINLEWDKRHSMCVVISGDAYPKQSSKNKEIKIKETDEGTKVFHAGTKLENNCLLTNGGRVIAVTGLGDSLEEAKEATYKAINSITFEGMDYRKDIGWRVISKCQSV